MNNLAIIPARSGSKGLKDKNIKLLDGKPLIAYSIEAAQKSEIYSHILVSTDSEKYGELAMQYGAEVPFYRSEENASDSADSWDVVKEVLRKYKKLGVEFDMFTLLQPTSPLRDYKDIQNAYQLLTEKKAVAIVSVCEMEHSPLWSNILPENNSLLGFLKTETNKQRQELETFYRINGAIYMANVKAFLEDTNMYREGCYAYKMPAERSIDIDTELDFKIAETIINK
ncbi:MAG: acylneuraminate cytidylyltransferase family protein [Clostridiales bacterium]|nr:acylneuraminate cytidylyltransferase family protein [Clostridiales bacterium]